MLFAAAIAYECYECQYEGKDPENLCLQPSEDSGKVSIESISQLRGSVISSATILLLKLNHKKNLDAVKLPRGAKSIILRELLPVKQFMKSNGLANVTMFAIPSM